ncbi:MAG TPA: diguanylate cyclase [Povalibacter sp.]|jgi:diguanylate cyclase (GGDEF)-like protein|nr:diguanylate cyclase [Povalibacter sp.]
MPPVVPTHDNEESLVSRVLARGYGWLQFPEPLESEFRADHLLASVRWVRMCLFVAVGTSLGFAVIDHWVIHASNAIPDVVRFGLQLPVLFICLMATYKPLYINWYQVSMQLGGPLFGIGSVLLASYAQEQHTALVGGRIILVAFFYYFMSGLRLKQTLRGNLIILLALIVAGVIGLMPGQVATYLTFALICANVIGGAGAYALEYANRTSFLERKLLVEIAELDGLTRLLNRQTFESRVRDTWRRAISERQAVTVIMIDVDHFKLYNDHYGHQAGDECLRRVAAAVRSAVGMRPGDCVARYGGEEIVAVLFDRTLAEAQETAQRVVSEVAALDIPHALAMECARVSVSVGAATQMPPLTSSYDAIVRLADSALYTAKRQGRDRCVAVEARTAVAA